MLNAQERTNYPFNVSIDDLGTGFSIDAQVDNSIDARRVVAYVETAIAGIVDALLAEPGKQVLDLSVLPQPERDQLLAWNATQAAQTMPAVMPTAAMPGHSQRGRLRVP